MTQFKAMKMKVNNPDHSKAVQEWLFEQGYKWDFYNTRTRYTNKPYLFTYGDGEIKFGEESRHFTSHKNEEINVSHLDPHSEVIELTGRVRNINWAVDANTNGAWQQSPCNPSIRTFKEKPMKHPLENLLSQFKHLQKAINKAEDKQLKRLQDRDRIIEKINKMLPEGYSIKQEGPWDDHWNY